MAERTKKVILAGSPNVGKSVIFGCLTGRYATVSNYPGTTVDITTGTTKIGAVNAQITDTPGLYSIFPVTEEEKVSLRMVTDPSVDLIIHVIDAKNLQRMLPLTFQLKAGGAPVIVVLNMFDEAEALGITIDTALLSSRLGLPVVATIGITGQGISQLIRTIEKALASEEQRPARNDLPEFSETKMIEWHRLSSDICRGTVRKKERKKGLSRADRIVLSPFYGSVILFLVLYFGLYKFVGVFGAGTVVDLLEGWFEKYLDPLVQRAVSSAIPWDWMADLFSGEYGILTLGLRYAVAIIMPIVGLFFFAFAVIEDSGYLPRLSLLLDRLFKRIGLSGRAVIPMVLGLGCDSMATVVTRTLPTKRERLISTLLLSLCIPCSAQIGVILGLLSNTPKVLIAWSVTIVMVFVLAGTLLSTLIPGTRPSFMIEIPPLRVPKLANIALKTIARVRWYLFEIVPVFIAASFLIWLGRMTGIFDRLVKLISYPLAAMGLPESAGPAFIFGFFRRDYGAAGLYDLSQKGNFTNNQLLIATVVLTLFLPCIAQFLVTIKERGWKTGIGISLFVLAVAFAVGMLINHILIISGGGL